MITSPSPHPSAFHPRKQPENKRAEPEQPRAVNHRGGGHRVRNKLKDEFKLPKETEMTAARNYTQDTRM